MNPGQNVICIDDTGWLVPDPGYEHLAPKKGNLYVVKAYERFGSVGAISLVGGNDDDFYRACRFRPLVGAEVLCASGEEKETNDKADRSGPARKPFNGGVEKP